MVCFATVISVVTLTKLGCQAGLLFATHQRSSYRDAFVLCTVLSQCSAGKQTSHHLWYITAAQRSKIFPVAKQ